MSKYKDGDKFILEIGKRNCFDLELGNIYVLKDNDSKFISENFLNLLIKIEDDYITKEVQENQVAYVIEDIKKEAYETGMNEAWEIAKKICIDESIGGISKEELYSIFNSYMYSSIMNGHTPQEAKAKIEEWEKSKEKIRVGDVVKNKGAGFLLLVTFIGDDNCFSGFKISGDDRFGRFGGTYTGKKISDYENTGKHFDLSQLFSLAGDS